jgi:hypothetical protein
MAAALCIRPGGGGSPVAFHIQPGSYDTDTVIVALGELRRFLAGEKATLIWDGLPVHRSRKMHAWLNAQRSWLVAEWLNYAPELNPVEGVRANLRGVELAKLVPEHLGELITPPAPASTAFARIPHLAYGFLPGRGLKAW